MTVPGVVGLTVGAADALAQEAGLRLAQRDADGPPLRGLLWPHLDQYWVVSQDLPPGTEAREWDSLVVEVRGGPGNAGDREPRRDPPGAFAAWAALELPGDGVARSEGPTS